MKTLEVVGIEGEAMLRQWIRVNAPGWEIFPSDDKYSHTDLVAVRGSTTLLIDVKHRTGKNLAMSCNSLRNGQVRRAYIAWVPDELIAYALDVDQLWLTHWPAGCGGGSGQEFWTLPREAPFLQTFEDVFT